MTAAELLRQLESAGCERVLDGDKLRVRGDQLNDDLRAAIRQHKPELVALLREQARPQVISNAFCFDCFRKYGKAARYQPHTAAISEEFPAWLELTCVKCGARCYTREQ